VPTIGSRASPPLYAGSQPGQPSGPQGQAPWQSTPPGQAGQAGGGGFLRTAMATAAGVAGGVLIAGAIQNLINPAHANSGHANTNNANGSGEQAAASSAGDTSRTETTPDASHQEVVDEDSSWFGDGGGDFDL
jgi:hypothetical protein